MKPILNIAAYKFAPLSGLKELRDRLLSACRGWKLKGTILLSQEGVNLFVAGSPGEIQKLLTELRSVPGLDLLEPKISESDRQPFSRMLVRIKKEIIAFGIPGIDPSRRPSPKISPAMLKQWLDEGRPLTLLDTRNEYEVKLGSFQNAQALGINHFREFPEAVSKLPAEMKDQPVVMFCTGGIRCEKAGPLMEREGFKNILQLDGGILKYFEECGSAHYQGECFVFDQRVGLDATLQQSGSAQCFQCLSPLTIEEQKDSRYVAGISCPYCFKTTGEVMALNIARRHADLEKLIDPLPGSIPYDQFRPVSVPLECNGFAARDFLACVLPHIHWAPAFNEGRILDAAHQTVSEDRRVTTGQRILFRLEQVVEPEVNAHLEILHEDEALIVVHKPAPLPMHPSGRFNRNTLLYLLNKLYHPQKPRPAHRLDANTSGVLLVTRTRHFAGKLQPQFARGEVSKRYLVRVDGTPPADHFASDAPISQDPGDAGSRTVDLENGQPARTEFSVLKKFEDGTTLLEARPVTGRTNQIRVHLWQMGLPVRGDSVYLAGGKFGGTQTLSPNDPPMCLHALEIKFKHPMTDEELCFTAPWPAWAVKL